MEDPERYLTELGVEVPCAMDGSKQADLTFATRSRLNFETFFFADAEAKARFDANPTRYAGFLVDPVSRVRFTPRPDSPRMEFRNRPFYFASDSTRAVFAATPDSFKVSRHRMMPRAMTSTVTPMTP